MKRFVKRLSKAMVKWFEDFVFLGTNTLF